MSWSPDRRRYAIAPVVAAAAPVELERLALARPGAGDGVVTWGAGAAGIGTWPGTGTVANAPGRFCACTPDQLPAMTTRHTAVKFFIAFAPAVNHPNQTVLSHLIARTVLSHLTAESSGWVGAARRRPMYALQSLRAAARAGGRLAQRLVEHVGELGRLAVFHR